MGCVGSSATGGQQNTVAKSAPRAPILLFYLPGPVRGSIVRMVFKDSSGRSETVGSSGLNIRFVDIPNQRSIRRHWSKELSTRRDYAGAIYLADLRDRPNMLMDVRTLNWFLKCTYKKYVIHIVALYSEESQLDEFKKLVPPSMEFISVCEGDQESAGELFDLLKDIESKFVESKQSNVGPTPSFHM